MMEKESTTVGEFVEEQLLDVYRGDIHKILSNVHRDLESLGCKDLPKVEEQFQLIEGRVEFFIEQIKFLQNKFGDKVIHLQDAKKGFKRWTCRGVSLLSQKWRKLN